MPLAVYVLGLAIFAQGTSELMLAGLLPEIAAELGVSIPTAGLLISAFALGMLVGAPVLAIATLRWPRRKVMLAFLAIFAVTHVAGALAPGYAFLFATRFVGAFVYAGFWAVAAATAVSLVPDNARGRAMSVVAGGLTVATVVGLPAGTAIGQHLGWRAAFWVVAAASALTMVGVLATIPPASGDRAHRSASGDRARPSAPRDPARPSALRLELRALVSPRLWAAYGTTALSTGATLVTFSYLSPLLTEDAGLSAGWVPAVLALYGIGTLVGITIGGRTADRHPIAILYAGIASVAVVSVALAVAAGLPALTIALAVLLGGFGFAINPALNTRVFALAEGAPTLAAATNVAAFNVGITAGPWLGGLAIDAGARYPSVGWIGAALAVLALGTVWLATPRVRAAAPAPTPAEPMIKASR